MSATDKQLSDLSVSNMENGSGPGSDLSVSNMENGSGPNAVRITFKEPTKKASKEESEVSCIEMMTPCLGCLGILLALGLIAGAVAYYVFAIKGLVDDNHFRNDCPNSDVWTYVLTVLILNFVITRSMNHKDDDGNLTIGSIFISFALSVSMAVWGTIILYSNKCDGMEDSTIWAVTIVNVVLNYVATAICVIFVCMITVMNATE